MPSFCLFWMHWRGTGILAAGLRRTAQEIENLFFRCLDCVKDNRLYERDSLVADIERLCASREMIGLLEAGWHIRHSVYCLLHAALQGQREIRCLVGISL